MSQFDPDLFLSAQTTSALDTQSIPVPEGEYNAVIKDVVIRQAKDSVILDVKWAIDDASVAAATGIKEPTVRQSVFLDMTASGGLDDSRGKNVQLGRLREAVKQNIAGQPWAPAMLAGNVARVTVKHRIVGEAIYTDIKGVAAL